MPARRRRLKTKLHKKYGKVCLRCREKFRVAQLTLDHIKPRSFGGGYAFENMQLLCGPCNGKKGQREIDYRPSDRALRRQAREA